LSECSSASLEMSSDLDITLAIDFPLPRRAAGHLGPPKSGTDSVAASFLVAALYETIRGVGRRKFYFSRENLQKTRRGTCHTYVCAACGTAANRGATTVVYARVRHSAPSHSAAACSRKRPRFSGGTQTDGEFVIAIGEDAGVKGEIAGRAQHQIQRPRTARPMDLDGPGQARRRCRHHRSPPPAALLSGESDAAGGGVAR
jgi:hypothetical protein